MFWYKFGIRIYLDKSLSPLRVDTYFFICPGNFVHQVTSILPNIAPICQYSIINMLLTTYSLKSIYLVWLENLHSAKKTLYWNYIRSLFPILCGNVCPILCGSTNIRCKWSHLEENLTALYFTVHIWLLWYQFCIWICLDKGLAPFRIGSLCPILSGILCPILCGNKNIGCKWSHLEEIVTALYFTVTYLNALIQIWYSNLFG